MANNNTILFRKKGESSKVDILTDFGIAVLEEPMLIPTEIKDVGTREWLDEDGIDVYNAPKVFYKDFDVDLTLGCKDIYNQGRLVKTCSQVYKQLLDYLTNDGLLHDMYCPWVRQGKEGVRYKSTSDIHFERNEGDVYMTFKMKLNVTEPMSDISEF